MVDKRQKKKTDEQINVALNDAKKFETQIKQLTAKVDAANRINIKRWKMKKSKLAERTKR